MEDPKVKCLISNTNDPWFNLAVEEWIFNDMDPSHKILFLWKNGDSVIIGRHQNPWLECNLKRIKEDGVNLVRRQSGGGAVFQDLGNSCFTFLSSKEDYDKKQNFQIVINALKKFNLNAEQIGRNDIVIEGKKISGSAFKEKSDRAFHHGTLMMNIDLSRLENYLTPPPQKLISKGVKSIRARVANLKDFSKEISQEALNEALKEEFFKTHNAEQNVQTLDHKSLEENPKIKEYYEMIKSESWTFGETPNFQHNLTKHFSWGSIDLHLNSENGKITKVKIYSDILSTDVIDKLSENLKNTQYKKQDILNEIDLTIKQLPQDEQILQDISNWLSQEIH